MEETSIASASSTMLVLRDIVLEVQLWDNVLNFEEHQCKTKPDLQTLI